MTTFAFSPKALDRAFVMEFNEMDYESVCRDWPGFDDARGALPYDTYTVQELRCSANEGYEPVQFLNTSMSFNWS